MSLQIAVIAFLTSLIALYFIRKYLTDDKLSSGDTYFHLHISKYIRNNTWKLPNALPKVTFDEGGNGKYHYLTYPPLFHYLTALFPTKYHLKAAKYINLVILSTLSAIACYATFSLTNNSFFALTAVIFVIFNLSVFELAATFTPRPLGLLFYSILICLSVFYPTNVLSLIAISLLTVLITLSHKFAVQILIIGIIPYAIIFSAPYLIVALVAGFLTSILISRGYYLKILKEHLSWLHFYSVHPSKSPIGPKLRQIALRNSWYFALAASAVILLLSGNLYFSDITLRIFYWAIIPLIAALIISLPVLSFLGEEYRYIEYSLAPVAITLILTLSSLQSSTSTLILLITGIIPVIAFIEYRKYLKKTNSLTNQYDIQAYEILKKKGTDNLFVIPHTRTLEVGYFTTLQMIHAVRTNSSSAELQLEHLLKNYKVDYVTHFRNCDKWNQFLILQGAVHLTKVQNFPDFDLYKIDKLSTNPSTQ